MRNASKELAVLLLYLLSLALLRPEVVFSIDEGYIGGNRLDAGLYVWLVRWSGEFVFSSPSVGFDLPFFYPFGQTLAYSDNFLLPSLLVKILRSLTNDFMLSYNLVLLSAILLNGYLTYRLVVRLTQNSFAGFFAGFCFLHFPFLWVHISHPQLQFAFFLPMALSAAISFLETRSRLSALAMGFSVLGAFLCSFYYSLFSVCLIGITLLVGLFFKRKELSLRDFLHLALYNIPSVLLFSFVCVPYLEVRKVFGERPIEELRRLSSDGLAYFSAPLENRLWGPLTHELSHFEAYSFPGALVYLFGVFGFYSLFRKRDWRAYLFLALSVFFVVISFGVRNKSGGPEGLFYLFYEFVPGGNAIRASGRFGVGSALVFCSLAGIGLADVLRSSFFAGKLRACGVLSLLVLLAGYELRGSPVPLGVARPTPGVYRSLASIDEPGAVISLPLHTKGRGNLGYIENLTDFMAWNDYRQHPSVDGYSGNIPKFHQRLPKRLKGFPDQESLFHLSRIVGLRYVVFVPEKETGFDRQSFEQKVVQYQSYLRLLYQDEQGNYLFEFQAHLKKRRTKLLLPPDTGKKRLLRLSLADGEQLEFTIPPSKSPVAPEILEVELAQEREVAFSALLR